MWEVCQAKLHSRSQSQALFYFVVLTLHVLVSVWRACEFTLVWRLTRLDFGIRNCVCESVCLSELAGHFLSSREGGGFRGMSGVQGDDTV